MFCFDRVDCHCKHCNISVFQFPPCKWVVLLFSIWLLNFLLLVDPCASTFVSFFALKWIFHTKMRSELTIRTTLRLFMIWLSILRIIFFCREFEKLLKQTPNDHYFHHCRSIRHSVCKWYRKYEHTAGECFTNTVANAFATLQSIVFTGTWIGLEQYDESPRKSHARHCLSVRCLFQCFIVWTLL